MLPISHGVFTRPIVACLGISAGIHAVTYLLSSILPLYLSSLGGSKTQIGMLFSVSTVVSMVLRPVVGGWNDRFGFRPVVLPGVLVLVLTSLALHWASTPVAVIALMGGLGLSNGLISTSAGVLVARASAPQHRGEALSLYYVASSLGWAIGPPLGLALYRAGGTRPSFALATVMALVVGALSWSLTDRAARPVAGAARGVRLYSRHALPVSSALMLTTLGQSSVYAFLPLYAMAHGLGENIGWFYALFSAWLIACRIALRRMSDRAGRARVIVPAMGLVALAYFTLALRPTVRSLVCAAVLLASGAALLYPTLVALLVDRTGEADRGLAIGTLSASFDVGVVVGSLLIGFVVERTSYAAGFGLAGVMATLGAVTFVMTERARIRIVPRRSAEVSF
jgi:MFS family permease